MEALYFLVALKMVKRMGKEHKRFKITRLKVNGKMERKMEYLLRNSF